MAETKAALASGLEPRMFSFADSLSGWATPSTAALPGL